MPKFQLLFLLTVAGLSACNNTKTSEGIDTGPGITLDNNDADGDGYIASEDCNDADGTIHPGAVEVCDGIDNDCDDVVDEDLGDTYYADADDDGYGDPSNSNTYCEQPSGYVPNSSDCDDADAEAYPGNAEVCDGVDNDCDDEADEGVSITAYVDADGDGFGDPNGATVLCELESGYVWDATDCDDTDADVYPGAVEEGDSDECMVDSDGDGFGDSAVPDDGFVAGTDCDDEDPYVYPGSVDEAESDECMLDYDGDGYGDASPGAGFDEGSDCDDDDAAVYPGAVEEAVADECMVDSDGDGFGDSEPAEGIDAGTDCDDEDPYVYPGAVDEAASDECMVDYDWDGFGDNAPGDGFDAGTDCDDEEEDVYPGSVGEAESDECMLDADGDGYGDIDPDDGYDAGSDCNDGDVDIHPGAVDEADSDECMLDLDGDGYGDDDPGGDYDEGTDCDDDEEAIYPGAVDEADSDECMVDADEDGYGDREPGDDYDAGTDCDDDDAASYPGSVEEGDDDECMVDADGDGFGDSAEPADGFVAGTDCDDEEEDVYPGAVEEAESDECMVDSDEDGYGDNDPDDGYDAGTDCDDDDDALNPDAEEVCDEIDNDCDELIDDEDDDTEYSSTDEVWYLDDDDDGFGDDDEQEEACEQPSGYVSDNTDCDDDDDDVNPDADEECDDIDNDCDDEVDEDDAVDAPTWYLDADDDGYGDADSSTVACDQPSSYEDNDEDCDDAEDEVNPSAEEICNDGHDNDCDGSPTPCSGELENAEHKLTAETAGAGLGKSVSTAGDIDGDGYDDIMIGAWKEDAYGDAAGAVYLLQGPPSRMPSTADSADIVFYEMTDYSWVGTSVSAGGDFLDTGENMVVIGAAQMKVDGDYLGAVFLSPSSTEDSVYVLSDEIMIVGEEDGSLFGTSVASGDISADGLADVLVGASAIDTYGGAAYVITGSASLASGYVEDEGVPLRSESGGDYVGYALDVVDDMDGDGYDEVLIGAFYEDEGAANAGAAYLVYGPITAELDLEDADSKLLGANKSDHLATAVRDGGDLNDDGVPDIVLSADGVDEGASNAGAVYVLFGPVTGTVSMDAADVVILGDSASDHIGDSLAAGADLDGDGVDDLAIGIPDYDGDANSMGGLALFLGPLTSDATTADAAAFWVGEAKSDAAAVSIGIAGDVDGDGKDDVLIGATGEDSAGSNGGAAYLVMGVDE